MASQMSPKMQEIDSKNWNGSNNIETEREKRERNFGFWGKTL